MAKEANLVERRRAVGGYEMFWSVVGGFCIGQATEIAGMLRTFIRDTGIPIHYSTWYNRLKKPGFPEFMRRTFVHQMNHLYQACLPKGKLLDLFSDIYIQDGSSYAVKDLLRDVFPGRFTAISPAAVEVHTFYSLRHGSPLCVGVAADTVSEYDFMPTSEDADLKNTLSLFDRGYGCLEKLHKIEKAHGFFITRMKDYINPRIVAVHSGDSRSPSVFENRNFKEIRLRKKQDYDFSVIFKKDQAFRLLRVIALWNPKTRQHVLLLTNTAPEKCSLKTIGKLYRLRWQIELLFKELKSHTELRKFLTGNANIVEGFIWAAFCALLIRRFLLSSAQKTSSKRLSFHKAAISARTFVLDFIHCALNDFHRLEQCLENIFEYLQQVMTFSNPHRPSSFQVAGLMP